METELGLVLDVLTELPHLAYGRDDPDRNLDLDSMDTIRLIVTLEQRLGALVEEDELRRQNPRTARDWARLIGGLAGGDR